MPKSILIFQHIIKSESYFNHLLSFLTAFSFLLSSEMILY
jgi:hypothetical protein